MTIIKKRTIDSPTLNVQASAEIGASAKYEIKKTITEHIPEDVVRAKTSAWLTMLSPFTQWAGLMGDKLAHKRNLLRVQQDETLTDIMHHAAPRLALLKSPIKPIPLKFLVPFLENASIEEPGSELMEMWANLLVASAENYNADNVYYVHLISRMSSIQARIFEMVIGTNGPQSVLIFMEQNFFLGKDFLSERISSAFESAGKPPVTLKAAWNKLVKTLDIEGLVVEHIDLGSQVGDDYTGGPPPYSIYDDKRQNDYAILRGLGLLEYADTGYFIAIDRWKIKVQCHYVSPLGLAFAEACGVQAKGRS